MVSFSCENCGDVLTKKKLDPHRNQCRGASFTCLDCMVHFYGTEYRSHTSCISEAQKYQGALYKEKSSKKQNRQSIANQPHNNENKSLVPRAAYVEDAVDGEDAPPPPQAPTPPPNPPLERPGSVNVFDFLVSESRNASQVSLAPKEQMMMKRGAPSLFSEASNELAKRGSTKDERIFSPRDYEDKGFSYGSEPIQPSDQPVNASVYSLEVKTPAAKDQRKGKDRSSHKREDSNLSDRKRKRGHVDPLDLSASNSQESLGYGVEGDTPMADAANAATPALAHSGLTGGLNRLLSDSAFPPSPDYSDEKERTSRRADPTSPLKRSRHTKDDGLGISIKGRAGKIMSLMGVAAGSAQNNEKALVKVRRRASSSESGQHTEEVQRRPRKHHRVHRSSLSHHGTSSSRHQSSRHHSTQPKEHSTSRKVKAIEYHYPSSGSDDDYSDADDRRKSSSQVVKYDANAAAVTKNRSEHFLSFVNKGPESEKGLSINKALKRWHRENADAAGRSRISKEVKLEEEKELWRGLRLRRNERGEIVVFF